MTNDKLKQYIDLMRLNKPIGIFLLLWPTLWALWLASHGKPDVVIVSIFVAGVVLMRSAGCIINDFADRHVDAYVERTCHRPLATGKINPYSALLLFAFLCICAFALVLFLNPLTIFLAVIGAVLTISYPFMKRFSHLPQLGLGLAFAWGVPMSFAAELNNVPMRGWLLFFVAALWPIIYDTMYAMIDRIDDINIGIKSTAILFGKHTQVIIASLQLFFLSLLIGVGFVFNLHGMFFLSVGLSAILFCYQLWLIKDNNRAKCFKAFLNNHWVGVIIFLGILLDF